MASYKVNKENLEEIMKHLSDTTSIRRTAYSNDTFYFSTLELSISEVEEMAWKYDVFAKIEQAHFSKILWTFSPYSNKVEKFEI
jgi:hypothetical protein